MDIRLYVYAFYLDVVLGFPNLGGIFNWLFTSMYFQHIFVVGINPI